MKWFTPMLCMLSINSTCQADTITLRADEWFPVNGDPQAEHRGYMIDIATKIWESHGHSVDYQIMPWERAIEETRSGQVDCIVGAYVEDAPDFVFPSSALGMDESHFFSLSKNNWKFHGINSLKQVRLGVVGGYAYDEGPLDAYIEKYANSSRVQIMKGNNALEQNIKKLISGRIDSIVESPMVMKAKLKKMGLHLDIQDVGTIGDPTPMYIACSPQNPNSKEYVEQLSAGIDELRINGELHKILSHYDIDDWEVSIVSNNK
ncbi:MAG: transporter substrate-binding domain-containing protein [Thalassolituus oleivorans]|nr:transporter substrate-binding domain-containing protein [Thalassolituus oleivorans]